MDLDSCRRGSDPAPIYTSTPAPAPNPRTPTLWTLIRVDVARMGMALPLPIAPRFNLSRNPALPPRDWEGALLRTAMRRGRSASESSLVRSGQVRPGQARSGQVRSGQARSGQARPGQVEFTSDVASTFGP